MEPSLDTIKVRRKFQFIQPQYDLIEAPASKKWLLGCAGEQGGKTSIGVRWLKAEITERHWDKPYNWLVGAPKYKILNQATIPTFEKVFTRAWGQFNKQEMSFQIIKPGTTIPWGKIFFRSSTDPDSGIGIPDCKGALLDEAGKCSKSFFYMAAGRVARLGGRIFMATTPYALNWVKKEVIDPYEQLMTGRAFDTPEKKRLAESILYRNWPSYDNPTYPKEQADWLKSILPPRIYNMRVMGIHDKADGLIHPMWGEENYTHIPAGEAVRIGAVDWGFDHPMATIVLAVKDGEVKIESVSKIRHMAASDQIELIRVKHHSFKCKMWFVGHDRPDMREDLKRADVPACTYFDMRPDLREVVAGDQKVSELIMQRKLKMIEQCSGRSDFEDEIETYAWDKDESDDDEGKERPIDKNNDIMAALRYGVVGVMSLNLLAEKRVDWKPNIAVSVHVDHYDAKRRKKSWGSY